MSNHLVVPGNITILPLPPKSPELNPVENLWHFMRENWLSNRVFKSYEDIVDTAAPQVRLLAAEPSDQANGGILSTMRPRETEWASIRRCASTACSSGSTSAICGFSTARLASCVTARSASG